MFNNHSRDFSPHALIHYLIWNVCCRLLWDCVAADICVCLCVLWCVSCCGNLSPLDTDVHQPFYWKRGLSLCNPFCGVWLLFDSWLDFRFKFVNILSNQWLAPKLILSIKHVFLVSLEGPLSKYWFICCKDQYLASVISGLNSDQCLPLIDSFCVNFSSRTSRCWFTWTRATVPLNKKFTQMCAVNPMILFCLFNCQILAHIIFYVLNIDFRLLPYLVVTAEDPHGVHALPGALKQTPQKWIITPWSAPCGGLHYGP